MKIIVMVQFGEEDQSDLRRITEWCNEAVAFFQDPAILRFDRELNGTRAIRRLSAGHPLTTEQVFEALREIVKAQARVRTREPHPCFPAELKDRYDKNLSEAESLVQSWLLTLDRASGD